jgi:hypothetical protein
MLFLAQFHTNFLAQHFKWLQEADEVEKKPPGFHCGQILVRYYLMCKDLEKLKTWINQKSFRDYDKNLEIGSEEKKEQQNRKSKAFIEEAITSLDNQPLP